ncbi:MAG: polysaccharide biosynthesis tyrosine autokinase [Holophagaceae bacterium]|nr:polysaccharide biosynthesis tyrosine autokinase [Holophagaceae bacterium]
MTLLPDITPGDIYPQGPSRPDTPEHESEISLGDMLANLWEGRYIILATTALALVMGLYYGWRKSPVYRVEAMLQIEDKQNSASSPVMQALNSLLDQAARASAEIEIIKSNLVLGRTVESLSLDIQAAPVYGRIIGDALVRGRKDAPELAVERFEIPNYMRGVGFEIIALDKGAFRWEGPGHKVLATGKVGEDTKAAYDGQPLVLQVRRLTGAPGQRFNLTRLPVLAAIGGLRGGLKVEEKGRQTNILGLSFEHRNSGRGAEILNEIVSQYVRQNIERKAEEASQTLAFMQEQLPMQRAKLDAAENRLNQFRIQSGSVDLPQEAQLVLTQSVNLEGQILALKQKKDELLRTYKEGADVVSTLNQQIAKLQKEMGNVNVKIKGLPKTQQEIVSLTRDVQVNTELYTAMLNNSQQLQVARAGEIGNARIVDRALPSLGPIKPDKAKAMGLAWILGLSAGIGLTLLRRALHRAVEDPRLIESRLGLPVVVTIPHSELQAEEFRRMKAHAAGDHILALHHPEDLAVESLRSLRTALSFTMSDARNRVVMISGPAPAIGKSFVSSNFSALLAQTGAASRVLLVDGDMRRGNLHQYFGITHRAGGLSEILAGQKPWLQAVRATGMPGLEIITSGTLPPNPSELLMSTRFADFILEVSQVYDIVIIDAPPVLAVTDAVIIGRQAGTTLLIAKAKAHTLDEIQASIKRFETAGIKPKGCIFNDVPVLNVGYRYYRYAYHYGYKK